MKYTVDGEQCLCCDIPEATYVDYPIEYVNSFPPSDGHTVSKWGVSDGGVSLPTLFDFEAFCFGGTLNSWKVESLQVRVDDTEDSASKLQPGMSLQMSVTGSLFTAGIRFWPKSGIVINAADDYDNERLLSIQGGLLQRVLVQDEYWPVQMHDQWRQSLDDGPDEELPLTWMGLVIEQNGQLYHSPNSPRIQDQCLRTVSMPGWSRGAGGTPHIFEQSMGDWDQTSEIIAHCYPDPSPPDITRVGFVVGITTWLDFVQSGFNQGSNEYKQRAVSSGTYNLSTQAAFPSVTVSYREECACFFRDELTLTATFPDDTSLNTRHTAHGLTITLTRAAGDTEYTGSGTIDGFGDWCNPGGTVGIYLTFDPLVECAHINLTCDCATLDCDPGTTLIASELTPHANPYQNLDPINVRYQGVVGPVTWTIDLTL